MKIAIVTGSTRPARRSLEVARWARQALSARTDATFELVDIAEEALPLFDEPHPPAAGRYTHAHTKRWAEKIASFDGFIFVTPEYNHGIPGALKNAIDFLFAEWNHKAAGFVSYGGAGGLRAVEQLRLVLGALKVADVATEVSLSTFTDFDAVTGLRPHPRHEAKLGRMADEVIAWAGALRTLRPERLASAA